MCDEISTAAAATIVDGEEPSTTTTTTEMCLPHVLLVNILQYLDSVGDLISCEKTCKAFQEAVKDDRSWSSISLVYQKRVRSRPRHRHLAIPPNADSNNVGALNSESLRDLHRYHRALRIIKKRQKDPRHHIVKILGKVGWKDLVERGIHDEIAHHCQLKLRGDASYCLAELLECNIVHQLRNAVKIARHRCPEQMTKCTLEIRDFKLQAELGNVKADVHRLGSYENAKSRVAELFNKDIRYCIVRRLAFVAGVTRMESGVNEAVFDALLEILYDVMSQILIQSTCGIVPSANINYFVVPFKKRKLTSFEDVRRIPPCPRSISDRLVYTVVPGQIEDAFKQIYPNISSQKCGGNPWIYWSFKTRRNDPEYTFWHTSTEDGTVRNEMEASLKDYSIRRSVARNDRVDHGPEEYDASDDDSCTHHSDDDSSTSSIGDDESCSSSGTSSFSFNSGDEWIASSEADPNLGRGRRHLT